MYSKKYGVQLSKSSLSHSNIYTDYSSQIQPIQLKCNVHPGSICLNYCIESKCCKLLCQQCISQHLKYHKQINLSPLSILSLKKVRQQCIGKCTDIFQQFNKQFLALQMPKNPQQIAKQTYQKLTLMQNQMIKIIHQQVLKVYQQCQKQILKSSSLIKTLQQIRITLQQTISTFLHYKTTISQGTKQLSQYLSTVLVINQRQCKQIFYKQINLYKEKSHFVYFDFSFQKEQFKNYINQCLIKNNSITTPYSGSLQSYRTQSELQQQQTIPLSLQSPIKYLHYFQTNSSTLHLINPLSSKSRQLNIQLSNYEIPQFSSSIMINENELFFSGGYISQSKKSNKFCKCTIINHSTKQNNFQRNFATVKPRSSHSLCHYGNFIYILGGYTEKKPQQSEVKQEKSVEKVDTQSGKVTNQAQSNYGGRSIAVVSGNLIIKASQKGVEVYYITTKNWSIIQKSQNYNLINCCGWTRISKQYILIYGGYNQDQSGTNICTLWKLSQKYLQIKNTSFQLPYSQGFLNNPGIIVNGTLYAIQCVSNQQGQGFSQNQRKLLSFSGSQWEQLQL